MKQVAFLIGVLWAVNACAAEPGLCFAFVRAGAAAGSAAHYEFNISPNGKFVAYASDCQPLCVWSADGGTQCAAANMIDTSHDLVSVRDDGDVLVAMATADRCVYENPASPSGIGDLAWGGPEIVEAVGREPQWISPATANLLRAWARKSKGYF